MAPKLSFEYVRNFINQENELISTNYINKKAKLQIKCKKCDEIYEQSFTAYQLGYRHQKCSKREYTSEKGRIGGLASSRKRYGNIFIKETIRICEWCKEEYNPKRSKQKFCTPECNVKNLLSLIYYMKLIVAIVASKSEIYNQFKIILVNYIIKLNNPDVSFYFLYSDQDTPDTEQRLDNNYFGDKLIFTDFYDRDIENVDTHIRYVSKSIFKRTIAFFRYLEKNNFLYNDTFVLRTNLTTFFDFNKLLRWLENKPCNLFFSGSFNGSYQEKNTTMSGTNMIMSSDIVASLSKLHFDLPELTLVSEDETLSLLIIHNLPVSIINIKRLDLMEIDPIPELNIPYIKPTVCFHKCEIGDESIFSFRFKTHDRIRDINCMNKLSIDIFDINFTIEQYVVQLINKYNFNLNKESSMYGKLYSENVFNFDN